MNLYISYVLKKALCRNVEGFIFLDVSQMNKWNVIFVTLDLKSRDVLPFHNIRLIISLSPDNKAHFPEIIRPNTLIIRKQALLSQDNAIINLWTQDRSQLSYYITVCTSDYILAFHCWTVMKSPPASSCVIKLYVVIYTFMQTLSSTDDEMLRSDRRSPHDTSSLLTWTCMLFNSIAKNIIYNAIV